MKIDPYKHKEKYENWKKKGSIIPNISKSNQKIVTQFIFDMESGANVGVSNVKGARSFARLNAYRYKLDLIVSLFEKRKVKDLRKITKQKVHEVFNDMREGRIKRKDKKNYVNVGDYVKTFKALWHWLQRVTQTKLEDVTEELDTKVDKPKWVFLDEKQFKKLAEHSKPYYKLIAYFELDTGLRATEFKNTRVSSFDDDYKSFEVTDEVSKTFGRKIKLMMSSNLIKDYVEDNKLSGDDLLFKTSLAETNQYFKRLSKSLFGEDKSKGGEKYSELTIGDMRHISATYWLPRYPTQQGMLYRFGWKKPDKIFYYSEFLGMVDNISQEDMLIDVTKTELQKELDEYKKKVEMNEESVKNIKNVLEKYIKEQLSIEKERIKLEIEHANKK